MRFEGQVVIVTGGGHGIGAAYCRGFAKEGAAVVIAERDAVAAQALEKELRSEGCKALAIATDVAEVGATQEMASRTLEAFGRIDVLLNNAAMFSTVPMSRVGIEEIPVDEWDRMMAVNLRGAFLCCRAVLPAMRQQKKGAIVNVSSGTAIYGAPTRIHYVTSKSGIIGFTRTLAREVGPDGVRVNVIAPGSTLSEENPSEEVIKFRQGRIGARALQRLEYPSDLVGAALFLASEESGFITGQTLVVDGGAVMV